MGRLAQTDGLTDVQQEILAAVRDFVDNEIIPNAQRLEHADEYPTDIVEGLKEMGIFGIMIPEEYGGLGESLTTYALCVEEIARGWMSVSGVINTHFIVAYMIMQHGTEEQKAAYLPGIADGSTRAAFGLSEPGAGSDVMGQRTVAVRDGDEYVLSGRKCWMSGVDVADWYTVHAKLDDPNHRDHTRTVCLEFFGNAKDAVPSIVDIKDFMFAEQKRSGVLLAGLEHLDDRYLKAVGYATKSKRGGLPRRPSGHQAKQAPRAVWADRQTATTHAERQAGAPPRK